MMIPVVFDCLVLLLNLYLHSEHLVWCNNLGPNKPPHQVTFTGSVNGLPHWGQLESGEISFK